MRFVPHAYQQRAIQMILDNPNVGCWMEPGLGKTVTTLTAIKQLRYEMWQVHKVLIVAPLKVAEATWQDEIHKWDGLDCLSYSTVLGTAKEREAALSVPADIYITNRDNVQWLVDYLGNHWCFDMVVLDEASSFKNHQAKRFRKLKSVRKRINRMVELTGTPSARDYMDLWAQVYLLDEGKRLGRTISMYRDTFFRPDKRNGTVVYSYKLRPEGADQIQSCLQDICFSMRADDYLDLPDIIVEDIPVRLTEDARKQYDFLEETYVLQLPADQVVDAGTAAVLRNKLLQVASGVVYSSTGEPQLIHTCKLDALMELLEGIHEPVLLFYQFRHSLPELEKRLSKAGLKWAEYHDSEEQKAWNRGEIDVLIAHPASCAYGLNLQQGGRHIVWYGLTDSLELYQQANARLHRQGQTRPVIIHRLVCQNTTDVAVVAGLGRKEDAQDYLLDTMRLRIDEIRRRV